MAESEKLDWKDAAVRSNLAQFKPIDNVPRNQKQERESIRDELASLLLHSAAGRGKMKELLAPIHFVRDQDKNESTTVVCYIEYVCGTDSFGGKNVGKYWPVTIGKENIFSIGEWKSNQRYEDHRNWTLAGKLRGNTSIFSKYRATAACKYDNEKDLLKNFGNPPGMVYGKFNLAENSKLKNTLFDKEEPEEDSKINDPEYQNGRRQLEDVLNNVIAEFFAYPETRELPFENKIFRRMFGDPPYDFWTPVFKFTDKHSYPTQLVLKFIPFYNSPEGKQKMLLPCTCWFDKDRPSYEFYCAPIPDKQPLYHLDYLSMRKYDDYPVVLCDSVEIADLNQDLSKRSVLWTSFMFDDRALDTGNFEALEHVDLSPLAGRTVYLLINNHSGKSFHNAVQRMKNLRDFLDSKYFGIKSQNIELRFAQVPVEYPDREFTTIHQLAYPPAHLRPKVEQESVTTMDENGFDNLVEEAHKAAQFYKVQQAPDQEPSEGEQSKFSGLKIHFILRPVIYEGTTTVLYGGPECGKTIFAQSLCGALISDAEHIQKKAKKTGRWVIENKTWSIPKNIREHSSVMFFNFESESRGLSAEYTEGYLPPSYKEECLKRFAVESLSADSTDPTQHKGQQEILNRIEKFQKQMGEHYPVRLVVFDCYLDMVHDKTGQDGWDAIKPLFDKITNKNISILLLHHINKDDAMAAVQTLRNRVYGIIRFDKDEPGTLEKPVRVTVEKASYTRCNSEKIPFTMKWDNSEKQLTLEKNDDNHTFQEEYDEVYNEYNNELARTGTAPACPDIDSDDPVYVTSNLMGFARGTGSNTRTKKKRTKASKNPNSNS